MRQTEEQECIFKVFDIVDYRIRTEEKVAGKQTSERVVGMWFCNARDAEEGQGPEYTRVANPVSCYDITIKQ